MQQLILHQSLKNVKLWWTWHIKWSLLGQYTFGCIVNVRLCSGKCDVPIIWNHLTKSSPVQNLSMIPDLLGLEMQLQEFGPLEMDLAVLVCQLGLPMLSWNIAKVELMRNARMSHRSTGVWVFLLLWLTLLKFHFELNLIHQDSNHNDVEFWY